MSKVIHITTHMGGGVGRVLTNIARQSELMGAHHHEVLCLDYLSPLAKKLADEAGLSVKGEVDYEEICREVEKADIVQIDWWNNPLLYKFMCSVELPAARLIVYSHVSGYYPPFALTKEIIDFSDMFVASTPHTCHHRIIKNLPEDIRRKKIRAVFVSGGISRVKGIIPKVHEGFNVGYIGTVDFYKMHPDFVNMSASVDIPGAKFIVCGIGSEKLLKEQAVALNVEDLFELRGFVEDIGPTLEILDVFGYPLCKEHYGTGEQALLEAMGAGIPPVVFSHGAEGYIVQNNMTGLLVDNEQEYINAIEYLYKNPNERIRLGGNAREYAENHFSVERTTAKFNEIYDQLMREPKHKRVFKKRLLPERNISVSSSLMGSDVFINSMGDSAEEFFISATSKNIDQLLEADSRIANCAPAMKAETRGSVFHYSRVFPEDFLLRFWSGLILQGQGKHKDAIQYFLTAYDMGYNHWRVQWYLAKSAIEMRDLKVAEKALQEVVNACPAFKEAKDQLISITGRANNAH